MDVSVKMEINLKCARKGCKRRLHLETEVRSLGNAPEDRKALQQAAANVLWHWPEDGEPVCPEHVGGQP